MTGGIEGKYPFIYSFLRSFNSFPRGYIFIERKYYPNSIRGICTYLESEKYVSYGGKDTWIKKKDLPSIDTAIEDMEIFTEQYKKTAGNNLRLARLLLGDKKI
jgi:hypothetical protein